MARRGGNPELEDFETYDLACELTERMDMTRQETEKFLGSVMASAGYVPVQTRDSWQRDSESSGGRRGRSGGKRNDAGGFSD